MSLPCPFCQHEPPYKHAEAAQQPYRGLWQALVARVDAQGPDVPIYQADLQRWVVGLWNEQPDTREAFALATTRYGREDLGGA